MSAFLGPSVPSVWPPLHLAVLVIQFLAVFLSAGMALRAIARNVSLPWRVIAILAGLPVVLGSLEYFLSVYSYAGMAGTRWMWLGKGVAFAVAAVLCPVTTAAVVWLMRRLSSA